MTVLALAQLPASKFSVRTKRRRSIVMRSSAIVAPYGPDSEMSGVSTPVPRAAYISSCILRRKLADGVCPGRPPSFCCGENMEKLIIQFHDAGRKRFRKLAKL